MYLHCMPSENDSIDRLRETADLLEESRRRIRKTTKLLHSSWDLLYLSVVANRAGKNSEKKDGVNGYVARETYWNG